MQIISTQSGASVPSGEKRPVAIDSMGRDISIRSEVVNGDIRSLSGNMEILRKSTVNGDLSSTSGNVKVEDSVIKGAINGDSVEILNKSTVNGTVKTLSGNITVDTSTVKGSLTTIRGNITANSSTVGGDVDTMAGCITVKNSSIGSVDSPANKLVLKGNNIIKSLVIQENVNNGDSVVKLPSGRNIVTGAAEEAVKEVEFRLPKGTTISEFVKFQTKKPGILIIEDGGKFFGKVINGIIRRGK